MARPKSAAVIDWESMHTRDILEEMRRGYGEVLVRQNDLNAVHKFVAEDARANTHLDVKATTHLDASDYGVQMVEAE